jgi:hypothetical protein
MKKALRHNPIWTVCLLLGLICTLILCSLRAGLESGHTGVAVVMARADVELLASDAGMEPDAYAARLFESGLTALFTPGEVCEELGLFIGDRYSGQQAVVGLVEDDRQYSYDPIEGFTYADGAAVVRVLWLRPEYADRYAALGYEGPEEIENLIYRAVTDRNIRVVWLTPFTREGEVVSDIADYCAVLENLETRIARQGLHLGQFSALPPYTPSSTLSCGVLLGLAAATALLLTSLIKLPRRWETVLALLGFGALALLAPRLPWAAPLLAAVVFPCLGVWLTAQLMDQIYLFATTTEVRARAPGSRTWLVARILPVTRPRLLLAYLAVLLAGFALSLLGGSAVGALESDRAWLLAVENFRGVKLSQIIPLLYAAALYFKVLYRGKSPRAVLKEFGSSRFALLALAALCCLAVLYILRTGDGALAVGAWEQRARNFLENVLPVRPRTKEFVAAWPALALAVAFLARGSRRYALPFCVLSTAGLSSVVNTFCHARSPLWLALTRSALGLGLGFILGAILLLLLAPRRK